MLSDKIKSLIELLEKSDINEIEVSTFWGHQKIKLKKSPEQLLPSPSPSDDIPNPVSQSTSISTPMQESQVDPVSINDDTIEENKKTIDINTVPITAPLVGTFYSRPKPESDSFVSVGTKVKNGDVVCIIEAMKIFNEIESEVSGEIVEILIEDSQPVEFGQKLFHVKEY